MIKLTLKKIIISKKEKKVISKKKSSLIKEIGQVRE